MGLRFNYLVLFACAIAMVYSAATKEWPDCPFPDTDESVYFPDTRDCRFFFQCSNGVAHHIMCAPGTVFNATINVCDHPTEPSCLSSWGA